MNIPWHELREDWTIFEAKVESRRELLGCSYRGAWFRGHENSLWSLLPTAFRFSQPLGLSDALIEFGGRPPTASDLRRARLWQIDKPVDPQKSNVESDVAAAIRELAGSVQSLLKELESLDDDIAKITEEGGQSFSNQASEATRAKRRSRKELQRQRSDLATTLEVKRRQIVTLRSLRYAEKDAYAVFRSRAALSLESSSWETLAAMQHHGAPTRLLDWTDTLAVAVYFATGQVRKRMVESKGSIANWLEDKSTAASMDDFEGLKEPAVWILNPFRLARFAIGKNTIEDLSLRSDLDYYECFHVQCSWPITYALPAKLPWRNPRMLAQRSYFTVHGTDVRGLEQQVPKCIGNDEDSTQPILACVRLPLSAAIFAVRYITQFVGLDAFSIFRDEDNLGAVLREFMHRKQPQKKAKSCVQRRLLLVQKRN